MKNIALFFLLIFGIAGLYLEQRISSLGSLAWVVTLIDYVLVSTLIMESLISFLKVPNKTNYLRTHIPSLIFLFIYMSLFILNKTSFLFSPDSFFRGYFFLIILRNLLLILKVFGRMRKFTSYIHSIFSRPAQTVVISFIIVILVGTLLLIMPIMSVGHNINTLDAFFTVTSAVCVTGLIVVDTASFFTMPGKITILILIQIGGLGIMLLSYFMVFAFRRTVSLKDRTLLTYLLNESDMKGIVRSVKRIIILTFSIELTGALLLFPFFLKTGLSLGTALFYSLFHAVSAFCNAGFSLYSDSLELFRNNIPVNFIMAALIITGGISFAVLTELSSGLKLLFTRKKINFSINTKVVLRVTFFLILMGTLFIYKLEHKTFFYTMPVYEQYLSAFFQSVTLRTAGFNTIPFSSLGRGTLMLMMGIMFIGGASGSTAGGIKVNTLGVVWAYINSFRRNNEETLLYKHLVPEDQILHGFTVILFGFASIFAITFILILTQSSPAIELLFEAVSAFATVGLSTGITASLTGIGKLCIIILMFFGRLGPLTLLSASSSGEKTTRISYPEATLLIG